MVAQTLKPIDARMVEARARAKSKQARVYVIEPRRHYQAKRQSEPGKVHDLIRTARGWRCSCPGYQYTSLCYALAQLEKRSEREGWQDGFRIARAS